MNTPAKTWNHESGVFTCGTCDGLQVVASHRRGTVDDPYPEVPCPYCPDAPVECKVCGNDLFSSDTKFDSGTGWPSFTDIAKAGTVKLSHDDAHGMSRTEVTCTNCGSHLGHVFDDGPSDTGKRYCINSVCLDLKKS